MSALVARELSGFDRPPKEKIYETYGTQQEVREMRFEDVYSGCQKRSLSQKEAALAAWCAQRRFRRLVDRYEEAGLWRD